MNKTVKSVVVVVVLAAFAYGGYWYFTSVMAARAQLAKPMGPPKDFALPVSTVRVRTGTVLDEVSAVGSLRSYETVILRPEIAGRISEIRFSEGQQVAKGAVLVTLDAAVYQAELAQTKANLGLSQSNYKRSLELYEKKFVSAGALDEFLAKLKADEANHALALARLEKTRLVAPFTGILGLRKVSQGDYVKEGQDIVNLEQIDPLKVDFHVPEIYLPKLKSDQPLTIAVDAYPGQQFSGRIYAIDPAVDQQTRTVLVRAHAPNPRGELRPGMFTKVNLALGSRENALLVPEQAIVPKGQDNFVFRILDGRAALTKVELGLRSPGFVEIVAGLDAADTVVTDGQIKLQDGMPVMDIAHLPPQKASAEGK